MVVLLLAMMGCNQQRPGYTSKPTRSLVNPDSDLLDVHAVIYHAQDSTSELHLKINNANLLYRRPDTSKAFYAELRVSYKMGMDKKKILDSNSVVLTDRGTEEGIVPGDVYTSFRIAAKRPFDYWLDIEVLDVNRRTKYLKSMGVYKSNYLGAQNFFIQSDDSIAFQNKFQAYERVSLTYPLEKSFMRVELFTKDFGPALPPFSTRSPDELKYKPDSVYTVNVLNRQCEITMPPQGFAHVKADPEKMQGLTLFTVGEFFPGVGTSLEMIQCTRYIMFREEYEKCVGASDPKAAIDEFWLSLGGSQERARELLRRYYGRVKEANKLYSSYTQGWKSDRGMIYIVMGPPSNVFRNKKNEVWVYGNDANPNALRFVFNKTENPFSDNDYVMERSVLYKEHYHTAVEFWRQGMVYFDNNRR